ncbi:MAG: copper oxidase [Rhodospirillales bacterium RIFCSPLOWO2_12_FULL_67_15]|nr:MAG: copper oxidase [Rhodospirillales bacterium RIFCSPLOWO2_12_FULL_67_15]
MISRRSFLGAAAMLAGATFLPAIARARSIKTYRLDAAPARANLVGGGQPETEVWAYNGTVPGPALRFRRGERARIEVRNALAQETTVHWHGLRVPNAMDGVPHVTQPPIAPGSTFVYEFDLLDAGTFWYHPHAMSVEQIERGLAGAFVVEEENPPAVDRDLLWVLDDWRLARDAQISGDFVNFMDASHAGRIGNTVTLNGRIPEAFAVKANERLRLRLVNVANARLFALKFRGLAPSVIALDGHPVEPHAPDRGRVVLGPGMRADVILDVSEIAGGRAPVVDSYYAQRTYTLVDLVVEGSVRPAPLKERIRLSDNPLPTLDLKNAVRHAIEFGGGMMDPKLMRARRPDGGMDPEAMRAVRERMAAGRIWTVNGRAIMVLGHGHEPLFALRPGQTCILDLANETAWAHPIHLHGMVFRALERQGRAPTRIEWRDTELLHPGERASIAFVAAEPGDWMLHCHVLEHQETGMMGIIRVG